MKWWKNKMPQPDGLFIAWTDDGKESKMFMNRSRCIDWLEKHGGSYVVVYNAAGAIIHVVKKK